ARVRASCAAVSLVAREFLEPWIGGLDDDLGIEAGAAQCPVDAEHFVPDRVAVPERRENLMDPRRACHLSTGPAGAASTISLAGRSVRLRRANHPGSGSRCA